jgi:hypothetical protein|tara:strand:+ start:19 stop:1023 length:1005 start_codon:yes stop_codon:yes gene_type:complete
MSTEEKAIAEESASPVDEAATPELDGEALIESQLEELFDSDASTDKTPTTEAASEKAPEKAADAPEKSEAEEVAPEGLDEDKLEEWSKVEAETPEIPADSEYLKDVVKVLPNREAAQYAIEAFQKQNTMSRAIETGDLGQALEAMPELKPLLQTAVQGYLTQNEEAIVQNWIDKNDPEKANPQIKILQEKFDALEAEKAREMEQLAYQQNDTAMRDRTQAIDSTVNELFDMLKFTTEESHRGVVGDLFKIELSNDPELMQKAIGSETKDLKVLLRKPLAAAIKRVQEFEKTIAPVPPPADTTNVITEKGGVGTDAEQDELDEAARYLASQIANM